MDGCIRVVSSADAYLVVLLLSGNRETLLYKVNGIIMVAVFFACRFLLLGYYWYRVFTELEVRSGTRRSPVFALSLANLQFTTGHDLTHHRFHSAQQFNSALSPSAMAALWVTTGGGTFCLGYGVH
jgi:fatty acid desaturase